MLKKKKTMLLFTCLMKYLPWQPSGLLSLIFQNPSMQVSQIVLEVVSMLDLQEHTPVEESHIMGLDTPGKKHPQSKI